MTETDFARGVKRYFRFERDKKIAEAVVDLLSETCRRPPGQCHDLSREAIEADAELSAFFRAVEEAGPEGWREEQLRVRRARPAEDHLPPEIRRHPTTPYPVPTVMKLLPHWRSWGRLLLQAEQT